MPFHDPAPTATPDWSEAIHEAMVLRRTGLSDKQIALKLAGKYSAAEIVEATGVEPSSSAASPPPVPGVRAPASPTRPALRENIPVSESPLAIGGDTLLRDHLGLGETGADAEPDADSDDPLAALRAHAPELAAMGPEPGVGLGAMEDQPPPNLGEPSPPTGISGIASGATGGLSNLLKAFSPDTAAGQGLLGMGLGILGAKGTYGDPAAAIGQGALTGLESYQKAKRYEGIDKFKRDQLSSVEKRADEENRIKRDTAASTEKNQTAQRMMDKLQQIRLVGEYSPAEARDLFAKDTELQDFLHKRTLEINGKPITMDEIKAGAVMREGIPDSVIAKGALSGGEGGGETPSKLQGAAIGKKLRGEPLNPNEEKLVEPFFDSPYVNEAARAIHESKNQEDRDILRAGGGALVQRIQDLADAMRRANKASSEGGDSLVDRVMSGAPKAAPAKKEKRPQSSYLNDLGVVLP